MKIKVLDYAFPYCVVPPFTLIAQIVESLKRKNGLSYFPLPKRQSKFWNMFFPSVWFTKLGEVMDCAALLLTIGGRICTIDSSNFLIHEMCATV